LLNNLRGIVAMDHMIRDDINDPVTGLIDA
jgi:hypothetical protein